MKQRSDFDVTETCLPPGHFVEGRAQPWCVVTVCECSVLGDMVQLSLHTQQATPAVAHGHMADFIAQDDVENLCGAQDLRVVVLAQTRLNFKAPDRVEGQMDAGATCCVRSRA